METPEIKLTDTNQILYSPKQVAIASFIGSPVAACWFFAKNYRQLGEILKRPLSVLFGGSLAPWLCFSLRSNFQIGFRTKLFRWLTPLGYFKRPNGFMAAWWNSTSLPVGNLAPGGG
ncbi:MAG: hypothetical protein H7A54_09255 [Akkermansiaceae bacterium]|nr:hypothetical protein [Akkermansiaceae bacterium]